MNDAELILDPLIRAGAEQAIDQDRLNVVSAVDARQAELESEHPEAGMAPYSPPQPASTWRDDDPWKPGNPDVVTFGQPALAVYVNNQDQIVIRQERNWCDEEDSFVILNPAHVDAFVEHLMACKAKAEGKT